MTYILSMFNTGQVTLPKKWRDKNPAKKYIARPQGNKLIIEPFDTTPEQLRDENVEIYDNGTGIRFKKGLSGKALDYFIKSLKPNV